MKKKILTFFSVLGLSLFYAIPAKAVCPVCAIAIVAGLGLSRWLGIDDTVSGLWIGAIIVALIIWTIDWLNKKNINFSYKKTSVVLVYYLLVIVPLYFYHIIGHPYNKLWGIDKLLLGMTIGSVVFYAGEAGYVYLKKKNDNKAHFPFQKVVMPVLPLIILSVAFYFITK